MSNDANPMALHVYTYTPEAIAGISIPARVGWASIGSVTPAEGRQFAAAILAACDEADRLNSATEGKQ